MLSDSDIASFAGIGSQGRRAEEDRERERLRQIHLAAVRRTDYDDDDLARDRERVRAIGGELRGTTRLSTFKRLTASTDRSLRVRPGGDLDDDVEEYVAAGLDPDSPEAEAEALGQAQTVAKFDDGRPTVGTAGLAFPQRFA